MRVAGDLLSPSTRIFARFMKTVTHCTSRGSYPLTPLIIYRLGKASPKGRLGGIQKCHVWDASPRPSVTLRLT